MHKIIIIGAGFAGLSAANRLSKCNLNLEVLVFDKKKCIDFLPLLPDAIGRRIKPEFLACDIKSLLPEKSFTFIQQEVISVDFQNRCVSTPGAKYTYDFLVVASGSQPNFFGNQDAQSYAYALNSVNDVKRIINALDKNKFENFVVCGGGYSGVEVATNLWLLLRKNGVIGKIVIVERSPEILGALPPWMRIYVRDNLKNLGINVFENSVVENIDEQRVAVSANHLFEKAVLIWVPGVRTADFIQKLAIEKNAQGRIIVDEYLRFKQDCFSIGDAALFAKGNNPLRMAVQFSIAEGAQTADNIARSIRKLPLKRFRPRDLGYIIPMANNKSCAEVLGFCLKGFLPALLHFSMCIYRLPGLRNKIGLTANLLRACLPTVKFSAGKEG